TKSLEDKEVDDDSLEACNFAESEYKKRIGNEISQKIEQGIIQEVVLFIQKEKLLTLSTNIPGTQDSNIEHIRPQLQLFPVLDVPALAVPWGSPGCKRIRMDACLPKCQKGTIGIVAGPSMNRFVPSALEVV
ncbi:2727_t:CDS:2, partial [Entrophospora sp. SA101]